MVKAGCDAAMHSIAFACRPGAKFLLHPQMITQEHKEITGA